MKSRVLTIIAPLAALGLAMGIPAKAQDASEIPPVGPMAHHVRPANSPSFTPALRVGSSGVNTAPVFGFTPRQATPGPGMCHQPPIFIAGHTERATFC